MWNGLWKLTAMVGVIGVGLFAAYQAQQGMNRTAVVAPGNADPDEADPASVSSSSDDTNSDKLSPDDADNLFVKSVAEPRSKSATPRNKKAAQPQIDLLDNFTDELPTVKTAVASTKSSAQVLATKRTQAKGVDFREEPESEDESLSQRSAPPKRLPEVSSLDSSKKKTQKAIRQVSALSSDEATPETEVNPFDTDTPSSSTESTPPESPAESFTEEPAKANPPAQEAPASEPLEEPGRARVMTDFSADSEPPRSKRAKKGAAKRTEQPVEAEANPFESDEKPKSSKTLTAPAEESRDSNPHSSGTPSLGTPSLGTPERLDEPAESAPSFTREPTPAAAPRSLPPEPVTTPNDDDALLRSSPKRNRPATLPDEPTGGFLSEPPSRSREPMSRRSEYDRVTPVDMVGDGVAGDASQRGLQQPRLTIEKIAQQQAVIDQPLVYTIIVKNAGSVDAHNVVIEDRIPKGTELQGTSPQAELAGKRLIWNHPLLKPNEEKKISIKVVPKQEGPIGSVARVYFATEVTAEIVVNAPQLSFTVEAPSEVRIGQKFNMVFSLKNVGKVDANNIIVRDLVPEQLKHEAGLDIECPIGKMAPQEVREIVLPVIAMTTGAVVNKAILTADSGVKKSLDSKIDIIGEVLVLTRSGQNRLYVERPAVFTNSIRNDGNRQAERVKVSEVVPAGMEFETASDGGKYDPNLRAVVWTLGPLAPGNDKSVTVKYVPKETGTHAAKVTATGNAGSTAAVNATVDVIGKPELQMETLSATGAVTVGDRITSRFQLNNTGTAPANNVQLRVRLPRELRLISVKGARFQQKEDYVLFETIGELPPRSKASYELILEPIAEADAQIGLEISADHLNKPGRRVETIQIARDALK